MLLTVCTFFYIVFCYDNFYYNNVEPDICYSSFYTKDEYKSNIHDCCPTCSSSADRDSNGNPIRERLSRKARRSAALVAVVVVCQVAAVRQVAVAVAAAVVAISTI